MFSWEPFEENIDKKIMYQMPQTIIDKPSSVWIGFK